MPIKGSDVLLERAAKKLGLTAYPAPVAILSKPHNGRPSCINCGWCNGFGCEVDAKSSSMVAMIPLALATGNCELRVWSTVSRIDTNSAGRVTEVVYFDENGIEQAQKTKAVVVAANGAETPRLLLMSESSIFPNGLANSSGVVGQNLMFNGYSSVAGLFDEPVKFTAKLRDYKTDSNLLLLKTEMNAGHGGKSGRDGAIEEIAIDYAFALKISKKINS